MSISRSSIKFFLLKENVLSSFAKRDGCDLLKLVPSCFSSPVHFFGFSPVTNHSGMLPLPQGNSLPECYDYSYITPQTLKMYIEWQTICPRGRGESSHSRKTQCFSCLVACHNLQNHSCIFNTFLGRGLLYCLWA